jgi:hypothetical protein
MRRCRSVCTATGAHRSCKASVGEADMAVHEFGGGWDTEVHGESSSPLHGSKHQLSLLQVCTQSAWSQLHTEMSEMQFDRNIVYPIFVEFWGADKVLGKVLVEWFDLVVGSAGSGIVGVCFVLCNNLVDHGVVHILDRRLLT